MKKTQNKELLGLDPYKNSPLHPQLMLEEEIGKESRRRYPRIWAYFDQLIKKRIRRRNGHK